MIEFCLQNGVVSYAQLLLFAKENRQDWVRVLCDNGRYALTITEAAEYCHIGENKLHMTADEHPEADFIIMNGNRILIKRQKVEEYSDHATVV